MKPAESPASTREFLRVAVSAQARKLIRCELMPNLNLIRCYAEQLAEGPASQSRGHRRSLARAIHRAAQEIDEDLADD